MKVYFFDNAKRSNDLHNLLVENDFSTSQEIETAEILVASIYDQVGQNILSTATNAKYILAQSSGIDHIDKKYCEEHDIKVISAGAANANSVAEYTIALMIMLLRNFTVQHSSLQKNTWRISESMGRELKAKTVGFIGCGAIASMIAEKLQAFSTAEIYGFDPYLDTETLKTRGMIKVDLDELLRMSDVVSLHLPLTNETRNLISYEQMKLMPKGSYLINTARGGVLDESALLTAIAENHIAGAALDVFDSEPQIDPELFKTNKLILTPHIAAFTQEADLEMQLAPVRSLIALLTN